MAPVHFEFAALRGSLRRALEDLDRAFEIYKRQLRRKTKVVSDPSTTSLETSLATGERQRQGWLTMMLVWVNRFVGKIFDWFQQVR